MFHILIMWSHGNMSDAHASWEVLQFIWGVRTQTCSQLDIFHFCHFTTQRIKSLLCSTAKKKIESYKKKIESNLCGSHFNTNIFFLSDEWRNWIDCDPQPLPSFEQNKKPSFLTLDDMTLYNKRGGAFSYIFSHINAKTISC